MAPRLRRAPPARLVFGVFTGFAELFAWVAGALEARFGPLDAGLESPIFPFPETRTYSRTMGAELRRKFFVLREPWPQDGLAAVKHATLGLEDDARALRTWPVERPINIDPGLVNDCRVILASTKDHAHRIYRGDGIWEEVTLTYRREKGSPAAFRALPWTYPDFRPEDIRRYFERLRKAHLESLRPPAAPPGPKEA